MSGDAKRPPANGTEGRQKHLQRRQHSTTDQGCGHGDMNRGGCIDPRRVTVVDGLERMADVADMWAQAGDAATADAVRLAAAGLPDLLARALGSACALGAWRDTATGLTIIHLCRCGYRCEQWYHLYVPGAGEVAS